MARFALAAIVKAEAKFPAAQRSTERMVAAEKLNAEPGTDQRTNCPADRKQVDKKDDTKENGKKPSPSFAFQAHIINASKIALADSNMVHWIQT